MRKRIIMIIALLFAMSLLVVGVYAHPGRTDENGGHIDQSTGEYHYHHGYEAHSHYDMDGDGDVDCPYDFYDNTGQNNSADDSQTNYVGKSEQDNSNQTTKDKNTDDGMGLADKLFYFFLIFILSLFFIPYIFSIPISWLSKKAKNPDVAFWVYYILVCIVVNAVSAVIIFKQ